jgi:hypothetical protein
VKEQWVGRETENILWIPPAYRPTCTAVHEKSRCFRDCIWSDIELREITLKSAAIQEGLVD